MKKIIALCLLMFGFLSQMQWANAEADLDVNTPAISAIKASMTARHTQLLPHYNAGAVGLTKDGLIAVKDTTAVPLRERGGINSLVGAENGDRNKLYKEIAVANGHPEWEGEIRQTFALRWIEKAQAGWHYQSGGDWVKK